MRRIFSVRAAPGPTNPSTRRPDSWSKRDPLGALQAAHPREMLSELRGMNFACWCRPDQPCHANVLLRLTNL